MNNSKFIGGGGGNTDVVNCGHSTHKKMPHSIWRILDFLNENCWRKTSKCSIFIVYVCIG